MESQIQDESLHLDFRLMSLDNRDSRCRFQTNFIGYHKKLEYNKFKLENPGLQGQ